MKDVLKRRCTIHEKIKPVNEGSYIGEECGQRESSQSFLPFNSQISTWVGFIFYILLEGSYTDKTMGNSTSLQQLKVSLIRFKTVRGP